VRQKKSISLKEFQRLMAKDKLNYALVRPNEIRLRFTEFVIRNQTQALMEQTASALASEAVFGLQESTVIEPPSKKDKKTKKGVRNDDSMNSSGSGLEDSRVNKFKRA
jgi:hypothetical protein